MPDRLLSDGWIVAVNDLGAAVVTPLRLDVSIIDAANPDGRVDASVDTTSGRLTVTRASVTAADVHVAIDYETAVAIMRSTDGATALDVFLAGRVLVQGGVMPLIALGHEILGGPIGAAVGALTG